MHYEYAEEPRAIGSSWVIFKHVIENFGFDKGRLISQFPKHWVRDVYEAMDGLGLPPVQKLRFVDLLNEAKKKKVVRINRPFDPSVGDWLHNALNEHGRLPFHAIIAKENTHGNMAVLIVDDVDELQPLMKVPHDCVVPRDAASLSAAMKEMLRFGSRILFVDPFYDPFNARYRNTLRECLGIVSALNPNAICEIHYRNNNMPNRTDKTPTPEAIKREAPNIFPGVIPGGMKVTIFCWREKNGGADFHARYLLTDKGGIGIDAGFSAEGGHQTTDMHLMTFEFSQEKLKAFARDATDYELVGPVIQVASDGHVENV